MMMLLIWRTKFFLVADDDCVDDHDDDGDDAAVFVDGAPIETPTLRAEVTEVANDVVAVTTDSAGLTAEAREVATPPDEDAGGPRET